MSELSSDDRLAVIETCNAMAWHADRREWDALIELFVEQVDPDYTSLNGGTPATFQRPARSPGRL